MATQYQVVILGEWNRKLVRNFSNVADAYECYESWVAPLSEGNVNGLTWLEDGVECQPQVVALPAEETQEERNAVVARLTGLAPLTEYEAECRVADFVGGLIPAPKVATVEPALKAADAAKFLGISLRKLGQMRREGRIAGEKINCRVFHYRLSDLQAVKAA